MIDIRLLAAALAERPGFAGVRDRDIRPLADTGLAHWHARIDAHGALVRIPKQSQMGLGAAANLAYQAACFRAAEPSGHTPRLLGLIEPQNGLPLGALIVEAIEGEPPASPAAMPAIARALAAIHRCPLTGAAETLAHPADPLSAMWREIEAQARHLPAAGLPGEVRRAIEAERARVREALRAPPSGRSVLISFDAHPGNFLITPGGRAVLVDLEKARISLAGFDLAHATLYTSTTWDRRVRFVLDRDQTAAFYREWAAAAGPAAGDRTALLELTRRLMWLWSISWCGKWRALSRRARIDAGRARTNAEDWSAENSDPALVAHVAARVGDYLSAPTVDLVRHSLAL